MIYQQITSNLQKYAKSEKAEHASRFFKTGKGEYGEGDLFLGATMPEQRIIAKKFYAQTDLPAIDKLLQSKIHEHRMVGALILSYQFSKADDFQKKNIYEFYLAHSKRMNNWDIVDVTTPNIVGEFLADHKPERSILYKLAKSSNLWEKRISIMATFAFIKRQQFDDTLKISQILLNDDHDLIHKAVGWMLREVGKRDQKTEEVFLMKHYKKMPRTMLRYAIEKFDEEKRQRYLKGLV